MFPPKLTHGDNLANLFEKYNRMIDYLRETRLVAGSGIRINKHPAGTTIESTATGTGGGVSIPAGDKGGPFAVEIAESENSSGPRVVLCNSDTHSGIAGEVRVGSHLETVRDMDWQPQAGVLFLDVTYDENAEEYVIKFKLEPTLPDTGIRRYILRIGEITYDSDTETYSAHQTRNYGDIEITNRWVK